MEFLLNFLHNGLATATRMAKFGRGAGNARLPPSTPCFLCHLPYSDCARHLFRVCPVSRAAVAHVFYHLGMDAAVLQGGLHRPLLGATDLPPDHHATVVMTADAVWRLRSHRSDGLAVSDVNDWVLSSVVSAFGSYAPASHLNSFPSHSLSPATVSVLRNKASGFGAAGSRTTEQAEEARAHCERLVDSLDDQAVQIWTDGSANPNPGPAGAGAWILFPDGASVEASSALGNGTNNLGELWAIGSGLERTVQHPSFRIPMNIHVFTDSEYALGILSKGWRAGDYSYIATAIRKLIREHSLCLNFHKVAAHVGIPGNERADRLAARGTEVSTGIGYPPDLKCVLMDYGFVGLDC
jgi:ribonuclease HI